jgi:nucleotide-binding universal stress UspA family protein
MESSRCVLVAVDGTPASTAALDQAIELASRLSIELVILAVAEPHDMAGDVPHEALAAAAREDALEAALEAARSARDHGLLARELTDQGAVAHCIATAAEEVDAQFIVVGASRRHRLGRLLGETVAGSLVNHSQRNVVVVHAPLGQPKS